MFGPCFLDGFIPSCTLILHSLLCWSCSSQCEFTGTALFFFFILAENNVANAVRHYPPLSSLMKIRSRRVFMCHGILCNVL